MTVTLLARDQLVVSGSGGITSEEVGTFDVIEVVNGLMTVTTRDAPDVDRTYVENGQLTVVTGVGYQRPAADPLLTSPYRLVLPRGYIPKQFSTSGTRDRTLTCIITRTRANPPKRVAFVYFIGRIDNTNNIGEVLPSAGVTIRAGIETLGATNNAYHITFNGGQDSVTAQPGDIVISDFMDGNSIGLGAGSTWGSNKFYAIKTECVSLAGNGGQIPAYPFTGSTASTGGVTGNRSDQQMGCTAAESLDQVWATGAITTAGGSTGINGLVPFAMIGDYADGVTPYPSVMFVGDSIADASFPAAQNYFGSGGVFIEKSLRTRTFPYTKVALASRDPSSWNGTNTATKMLMSWCSHAIWQMGTNGLATNGATAWYNIVKQFAYDCRVRGVKKVVGLPISPRTTSTDHFATAANQSAASGYGAGAERDIYNALLSAGAGSSGPGVDIFVDTSAPVQDLTTAWKWLTDGNANTNVASNDDPLGLHPTEAGHALMAVPLTAEMTNWQAQV